VNSIAQNFLYRARNSQGKVVRGSIAADSSVAATAMLRARKLFVVGIKPVRPPILQKELGFLQPKVSTLDLALFCRHFATMHSCGVPIIQCLNLMVKQTNNKKLAEAIKGLLLLLGKGRSLADAARGYPKVFPPLLVSMLEAGESSGALDTVLERLAVHFEKEYSLREKVKSALIYPVLVLATAVAAVAVLIVFVLPSFVGILTQYNAELPLTTKMVLGASKLLSGYWYLLALAIAVVVIIIRRLTATERGRTLFDMFLLRLPVFGGLIKSMVLSRFTRMLGTLLSGGVPLLQALDVVSKLVGVTQVKQSVVEAAAYVREGQSIAGPLGENTIFPPMVKQMMAIGEETGKLDFMLEKLGDFYDREVDDTAARLSALIEPLLIIGLGAVVGFIILSILTPMFSIISTVN